MNEITRITKNLGGLISKNSPHILTGLGCAGVISTAVLSAKASPRALIILQEEEMYREKKNFIPMSKTDRLKLTWKCYIPATVTTIISVGCLVGASSINTKRNAALAAAYALSDSALREYHEKVVETIGEKKEKIVEDKISEDKIKENPVSGNEIYITGKGESLCFEPISGRYFKSDIDMIKKAENLRLRIYRKSLCILLILSILFTFNYYRI